MHKLRPIVHLCNKSLFHCRRYYNIELCNTLSYIITTRQLNRLHDRKLINKVLNISPSCNERNLLFLSAKFLVEAIDNANNNQFTLKEIRMMLDRATHYINSINDFQISTCALAIRIATLIRDGKMLIHNFDKYMKILEKNQNIELSDLITGFVAASHVGKWKAMIKLGEILNKRDKTIIPYLHEMAVSHPEHDLYDYASIYDLAHEQYEDESPTDIEYRYFNVENVSLLPISIEDCGIMSQGQVHETRHNIEKREWMEIDHKLPELIMWGHAAVWYQLNGGVVLSGIVDKDLKNIRLKGYMYHEEKDKEPSKVLAEYTLQTFSDESNTETIEFYGTHRKGLQITKDMNTFLTTWHNYEIKGTLKLIKPMKQEETD